MSSTPAASKSSQDWNTVTSPKTRGKRSADPRVDTKLLVLEDSLSAQKAAFETHTITIKNQFDTIKNQFDDQELKRKSDTDRLLEAIMAITPGLEKKLAIVSDDVATLSIDVREIKEDLETEKRDRKREIEGLKFDIQKESEALQVNIDQASRVQATDTSTPTTTRASSAKVFPRFSTSYGGIRSPVPADLTADIYYQDITPADHNLQGSYIDPSTPIPTGKTGSSNSQGESQPGLHSIVGNSQINLSKFQDKIKKLVLRDDSVTSVRDWYHSIRLALNTSGKTHIDVLPMFEMLKKQDRFANLLLPVDLNGDIGPSASSFNLCLNMYHSFSQVLLTVLTTSTTMFPASKCPKAHRLIQVHRDLRIGWDLVWNILRKLSPHLGGTNINVHDQISALSIIPGESLPEFYNRALDLQNTIVYSKAAVPPTRLIARFIDQLMLCAEIRPFLAHKKSLLNEHIQMFGENIKTPLDSLQTIFEHLDDLEIVQELRPKGSATNTSILGQGHEAHMAKFGGRNIPECEVCFRRGHHAGTCVIRGPNFVPADIQRRAQQYNLKHGDKPLEPLRSWTKNTPPGASFPKKLPGKSPIKPAIKYFYADTAGDAVEIDPSKLSVLHTSEDSEEIFHEAQENTSETVNLTINPMISAFNRPSNNHTIPLFPDYSSMFDPLEIQLFQEN